MKPDKDGEEYMVRFEGNHLSRNELQTKLPTEFFSKIGVSSGGSERWLDNQTAWQIKNQAKRLKLLDIMPKSFNLFYLNDFTNKHCG